MHEETVIFDGDEGVLQVRRHPGDRHVVALFVEAEPALAVRAMEPGVPDSPCQPVDVVALLADPAEQYGAGDSECVQQIFCAPEIRAP